MTVQKRTTVLPGNRIELHVPEFEVGETVSVRIDVPVSQKMLDFLRSLPPSQRTEEEWDQFDKDFRAERDAWD